MRPSGCLLFLLSSARISRNRRLAHARLHRLFDEQVRHRCFRAPLNPRDARDEGRLKGVTPHAVLLSSVDFSAHAIHVN